MPGRALRIAEDGQVEAVAASLGGFDAVVDAGGSGDYTSIASAFSAGNARVLVLPGTYSESSTIAVPDGGALVGQGDVIVDFTGAQQITATAAANSTSAGTVSTTIDSTTVTGSGTSFQTAGLSAGDWIWIDGVGWLEIASVASNTSLTVTVAPQIAVSAARFLGSSMLTRIRLENFTVRGAGAPVVDLVGVLQCTLRDLVVQYEGTSATGACLFIDRGQVDVDNVRLDRGGQALTLDDVYGSTFNNLTINGTNFETPSAAIFFTACRYLTFTNLQVNSGFTLFRWAGTVNGFLSLDALAGGNIATATAWTVDDSRLNLIVRSATSAGTNFSTSGDRNRVNLDNNGGTVTDTGTGNIVYGDDLIGVDLVDPPEISGIGTTATFDAEHNNGNQGATWTLNWNNGQKQRVTLTASTTSLTITAPPGPGNFVLKVIQDATGGRTITWPASVLWPNGSAPTLSGGANAVDIISFYYDGTNYYGVASLNFS